VNGTGVSTRNLWRVANTDEELQRREYIRTGQKWLASLGYYSGEFDGRAGLVTLTAMRRFMDDAGLSGRFNTEAATFLYLASEIKTGRGITAKEAFALVPPAAAAVKQSEAARVARDAGHLADAERLYRSAVAAFSQTLGADHAFLDNLLESLAILLRDQGRFREAEPLFEQLLVVREKALGEDDPDTLDTLNRLGLNFAQQGNYAQAEALYEQALAGRERVLGPDHLDTLISVGNLGHLYMRQGHYKKAEEIERRAYENKKRVLGPDHRNTLLSLNNLAYNYLIQGRFAEAEPLFLELRDRLSQSFGAEDPDLLRAEGNLGFLYEEKGQYKKAEEYYQRILKVRERLKGADDLDTLSSVADLGTNYKLQGRYGEAERSLIRALEGRKRVLGEKHPTTLASMNDLALLYQTEDRLDEAEPLFKRTVELKTELLGESHPSILTSLSNLGLNYEIQKRYSEAEPLYLQCMNERERVLGPEHPDTLLSFNNLGFLYYRQKRFDEAEILFEKALEGRKKILGEEHPRTLLSMNNLARLYEKQRRFPEAERLYTTALEAKERVLGADHPSTLQSVDDLADLYQNRKTHDKALRVWKAGLTALPAWIERTGFEAGSSFELPLNIGKYLKSAARSGLSAPEAGRQTFEAQGWFTYDTLDKALADLGARLGTDNPATADLLRGKQDLRDKISGLRNQYAQTFSGGDGLEDRRGELLLQITALERQITDLDDQIAAEAPELFELSTARPLGVEEAQALLEGDEAMVAFAWTGEALYIWLVRSDSIDFRAVPETDRLAGLVSELRQSVDLNVPPAGAQALEGQPETCLLRSEVRGLEARVFNLCSAHELYRQVLEPFEDRLDGVSSLIVIPDGPLEELPFSLLVRERPGNDAPAWLVRDMAVTLLPTTSSLRVLRTARAGGPDGRDPYLGIAPGDFRSGDGPAGRRGGLAPLPGTLKEVRSLSEILGASSGGTVTGERASEDFVKTAPLQNYRVLSFATHGLLAGEVAKLTDGAIREPALAFAPSDGREDGLLTATEAATLRLNADWLLLSACNTAAASDEFSSGYSGLTRAFFFAGAKSLLVSHWSVDDGSALTLMLETVRGAANGPSRDKASALRRAMLTLMAEPAYNHPFFWAPFSLIGDNRSARQM